MTDWNLCYWYNWMFIDDCDLVIGYSYCIMGSYEYKFL